MKEKVSLKQEATPLPSSKKAAVWLLAVSQGLQSFGTSVFAISLALLAGQNGDFLGLGLVLAARTIPTVVVALFGGVAADLWSKKLLAILTLLGVAVLNVATLFSVVHQGLGPITQVISLASGLISAFGAPALYTLLPSVVSAENNFRANAVVRTFRNAGSLLGPILATFVSTSFQTTSGIALSSVFFVCSALCILPVRISGVVTRSEGIKKDIRAAFSALKDHRWFGHLLLFWALFLALQSGFTSVLQPIAATSKAGPASYGAMAAALAVGYLMGSLLCTKWKVEKSLLTASVGFFALCSLPNFALATFAQPLWWCLAAMVAGLGLEISGVAWGSALQTRVPEEHLGKFSSLDYAVSFGLLPVGYALCGFLGASLPTNSLLLVGGWILLLGPLAYLAVSYRFDVKNSLSAGRTDFESPEKA